MGEELVTEAGAVRAPANQAQDVGEDELALAVVDRPEDRLERREGITRHLRRGPREASEQRRLAAFGSPTSPASASSFSRGSIHPDSPGRPRSANRGVCRVEWRNACCRAHAAPPRATTAR